MGQLMSMTDIPVLRAIKDKLKYHEARQKVLAENVSNADTPGYTGRDIKAPDFFRVAVEGDSSRPVAAVVTSPLHIATTPIGGDTGFRQQKVDGYEVTPDGNSVSLEDQMMKVTQNQMDYQMATSLYARSLGLLKTALGKK
jgi:flagellar basal-body rod protein FlgB